MKKLLAIVISMAMIVAMIPAGVFADGTTESTEPTVEGDVITVTPKNVQDTLDGKYGSIDNKTILLSAGTYNQLELGRATKYADSNTEYRIGSFNADLMNFQTFYAGKNDGTYSGVPYYIRNMSNVTFKAAQDAKVNIKGVLAASGHHHQNDYDYVLDRNVNGNSYHLAFKFENITFEGINFINKSDIKTSLKETIIDGFTFKDCTFNINNTNTGNQAIHYYNENNNDKVKNLTVDNCEFKNCYQGVYTSHINGIKVINSAFVSTAHNAIAIQDFKGNTNHGVVVITNNTFNDINDRIIRFNNVGAGTQITIKNNTATDSGDNDGQVIKATSLADGITYDICGNDWGNGKVVANEQLKDAVVVIGSDKFTSLEAAIKDANEENTITLLDDITLTEKLIINKPVTIDGNNHKISINNDLNDHLILLSADATIKNVTLDSNKKAKGVNTWKGEDNNLNITFENVKMLNSKGTGLTAKAGTIILKNVEISGSQWTQSIDISASKNPVTTGAKLVIDNACQFKDPLQIVYDFPEKTEATELAQDIISASGWSVSSEDKAFGEDENKYIKRIFTLTKPSTGGGGGAAVVPPATDNVTNNPADKNTTADLTPAVKDNKAETTVDAKTADKIVDKAVANKSTEVIVDATGNNTVASSEVAIPEKTVKELAEKTDASLVIKTDNGKVDLDKTAVKALADQAGTTGTVKLIVETVKNDADICHVNLKLVTSNGAVTDFRGGNVKVTINLTKELAAKELVCVYIDDNGIYTLVEGVLNADGTYTFTTGHFSEYAVMAKAEADKKIAEQLNTLIKEVNLKVRTSKTAKKNIKAVVSGDITALTDAGYTVKYKFYRSTKKASKYVSKGEKTADTYINTAGKKGTKYYYKAKAMVYSGDTLVGQTVLKQCKYGVRTWSK